jgi:tRNA uridine 5-carboxymethylaminomethyl modification enzyme
VNLDIPEFALQQVEIEVKYAGFIERQLVEVERFKNLEKIKLPLDLDYVQITGLSREIKEKLSRFKPLNLGQASRISGVTPAAISLLMVYLRKMNG